MPEYCATCFKEAGAEFKGKMIGGVCPDCFKEMKGKDSVNETTGIPKFDSMDDLEKFLKAAASLESAKKGMKPKSKKSKGKEPVDTAVNSGAVANEEIYQSNHFYLREKDTIEALRKDVKEERKLRNENVLVFIHGHTFGLACNDQCKEVT